MNDNTGLAADAQLSDRFATIPDVPLTPATDRVSPNQMASGVGRGTTEKVVNTDGSYMTTGLIPDGSNQLGIAFFTADNKLISKSTSTTDYKYDTSGNLISQNNGQTLSIYNPTTGKNIMQIGKLPDSTYGWAVAAAGLNVADGFS